jgi:hypothetical protein
MTRSDIPASFVGHGLQGPGKGNVVRGSPKGRTRLEYNKKMKDRGSRQQLHLGSQRAFNKTVRHAFGREVAKRAVGTSLDCGK